MGYDLSDLQVFKDASEVIIQCRQVLKWAFVVGFFSETQLKPNETELFKH